MSPPNGSWVHSSGGRRHDVEVAQEEQRLAAGAVAAQPGDDRAAARDELEDLGPETGVGERAGDPVARPASRRPGRRPAAG